MDAVMFKPNLIILRESVLVNALWLLTDASQGR
jgi:hypothetical protein